MSLHLMFYASHHPQESFFPSQAWSDNPVFNHVELVVDNKFVVHQNLGRLIRYRPSKGVRPYDVVRVRIPDIHREHILQTLDSIKLPIPYRWRDYRYAAINGHCPRSILKTGFTCATIVAYLLGHPEYYSMSPDRIYAQLI